MKKLNHIFDNVENIKIYQFPFTFNLTIKNKTILIFEGNSYHSECLPGFSKYFVDLGYNIDIIMNRFGKDTFNLFEHKEKIRIIIYDSLNQIIHFASNLSSFMNNYSFIIIQTTTPPIIRIISYLGLLNKERVIYIFHFTKYYYSLNFSKIENQNRIWTLGHFSIGLQVNPHYIGKIKLKNKNKRTRFFIVSTEFRNYNYLISASEKLKDENLDFDIAVTGKIKGLSLDKIKDNFIFNYNVNFSYLYKIVDSSDYIIITLDPDNPKEDIFKYNKVTGSAQLSYGFLKPVLINNYFSDTYNMTKENSFIFDRNNFYNVMRNAIATSNNNYKIMQKNLMKLSNNIYQNSLKNVEKTLNSILYKY